MAKREGLSYKQATEIFNAEQKHSEQRQKELDKILPKVTQVFGSIHRNYFENKPLFCGIENKIHEAAGLCKKSTYFNNIFNKTKFENMLAEDVYFNYVNTEKRLGLFCAVDAIAAIVTISDLITQGKCVKNKELLRSEIRMSEKIKDINLDIELLKDIIEKISGVDDFLKCRESIKYRLGELERDTTEYEVYKALAEGLRAEVKQ